MKKIIFLLLVSIAVISCTKENSFTPIENQSRDSSFIYVEHKPMPKAVIPAEIPKD